MIICSKEEIGEWISEISQVCPSLSYVTYSIFSEAEDLVSRYEFYS